MCSRFGLGGDNIVITVSSLRADAIIEVRRLFSHVKVGPYALWIQKTTQLLRGSGNMILEHMPRLCALVLCQRAAGGTLSPLCDADRG